MEGPALQVIVLGSGGGPKEDNTTAFLARSTSTEWTRGSMLAVDAGIHLAAVARILEPYLKDVLKDALKGKPNILRAGPFKGLELPYTTLEANAAHITFHLVDTYLITHPHLDHISGFVVNTAGFSGTRQKRLAALPSTITAFKNHIFNNVIWPNLSDENGGFGLVTYMRLVDGGSLALGEGEGRGYVEICDGLSVKAHSISHGGHGVDNSHRGSVSGNYSYDYSPDYDTPPSRTNSHQSNSSRLGKGVDSWDRREVKGGYCVYDSSAYFIRDAATGREALIFGDVEPDSVSMLPRNRIVWMDAAPKIASASLTAIFIECSYPSSQKKDQLYGHLTPPYIIEEMTMLASCVESARTDDTERQRRKRKRIASVDHDGEPRRSPRPGLRIRSGDNAHNSWMAAEDRSPHENNAAVKKGDAPRPLPPFNMALKGLRIIIIHVKDKLADGESNADVVLRELRALEQTHQLGCEFELAKPGMSIYV